MACIVLMTRVLKLATFCLPLLAFGGKYKPLLHCKYYVVGLHQFQFLVLVSKPFLTGYLPNVDLSLPSFLKFTRCFLKKQIEDLRSVIQPTSKIQGMVSSNVLVMVKVVQIVKDC